MLRHVRERLRRRVPRDRYLREGFDDIVAVATTRAKDRKDGGAGELREPERSFGDVPAGPQELHRNHTHARYDPIELQSDEASAPEMMKQRKRVERVDADVRDANARPKPCVILKLTRSGIGLSMHDEKKLTPSRPRFALMTERP